MSKTERVWNTSLKGNVEVGENIGTVLVDDYSQRRAHDPSLLSILPTNDPLQSKLKNESSKNKYGEGLTAYGLIEPDKDKAMKHRSIDFPNKRNIILGTLQYSIIVKPLPKLKVKAKSNLLRLVPLGKSHGQGIIKT